MAKKKKKSDVKKHEDKFIHIPKICLCVFGILYIPLWFICLTILTTFEFIVKLVCLWLIIPISTFISLDKKCKDVICFSWKPNYNKANDFFHWFIWVNDKVTIKYRR